MKNLYLSVIVLMSIILLSFSSCNSSSNTSGKTKYKARFEIAGICSNYTFSIINSNVDTSLIVPKWKDETTGRTYKNAFTVKNPCLLPKGLKVGDTFDFVIDNNPPKSECIVCLAYYPVPSKSLSIKVVK